MAYIATITDNWETCPGTIVKEFQTRKEALLWAAEEMSAAQELFKDGRSKLSYKVQRQ